MKAAGLILVTTGCVLGLGPAHASAANHALRQGSRSSTTVSGRASNQRQAPTANQGKDHLEASASHQHGESGHSLNKPQVRSQSRLPMPRRPKPPRNIRGLSRSQDGLQLEQPTLNKPRALAGRIASPHGGAIRPSTGSAIGGPQSRHGRNLALIPAGLGGPTRRNTQTVNGSEVHRRH
jgi:hypothetical protein